MILLEYGDLEGGLARMMDRFRDEGTLTGDVAADDFIRRHPEAAFLGLLFDQRVRAEFAFTGPQRLYDRLGHLDLQQIAAHDPDAFRDAFGQPPAVHRFTNKMAEMTQAAAGAICADYEGRADNLWNDGADSATIAARVRALPGFGKDKARKMRYVLHYFGYRDFSSE